MKQAMIDDLPEILATRLAAPLPGKRAQSRFAPELSYGRHCGPPAFDARPAAVLVLLYLQEGEWHVPLTLRPDHMAAHAGQISFPGGVIEPDESIEECALRELDEELGVIADGIKVLGRLSPLNVFNSNYLVTPCVAAIDRRPDFRPNAEEVAQLVELPAAALLDSNNYCEHEIHRGRICFNAPHIEYRGQRIWGATSMILGELIEVLCGLVVSEEG